MRESRWLRWTGIGVIALVAVASIASTAAGAGRRPWIPRACADLPGARGEAARAAGEIGIADLASQAWFRLDPRLDRSGALEGQRLALGLDGDRSVRILDLPAESFAAGPFGRAILVGSDDGSVSHLEVLDVTNDCSWPIADEAAVVRRATIDAQGSTVYEMRVDRSTRADLGIWARSLDSSEPASQVLGPIDPDERFGTTWSTELTWDLARQRLAVQSCGEAACRTRVFDPADGSVISVTDPDLGDLVGLDGNALVTYAACPGLPCPVLTVDLGSGVQQVVAEEAAVAVLASTAVGSRLVYEEVAAGDLGLRSIDLSGTAASDLGPLTDGLRLHPPSGVADAATGVPDGWVLVGPDGRFPDTGPAARTQLRHVQDGATVQLDEVLR